jgi:hypothetical protein
MGSTNQVVIDGNGVMEDALGLRFFDHIQLLELSLEIRDKSWVLDYGRGC